MIDTDKTDIATLKEALRKIAIASPDTTKEDLQKLAGKALDEVEYNNIPG